MILLIVFQIAEVLPGIQRDQVLGLCHAIEQVSEKEVKTFYSVQTCKQF